MYKIFYDFTDDYGNTASNCYEFFEGDWFELQEVIKKMRKNGCYNIDAVDMEV